MLRIWSDDQTLAGTNIDLTISVAHSEEIARFQELYVSISLNADEGISMEADSRK